jgi:hypothetical protein
MHAYGVLDFMIVLPNSLKVLKGDEFQMELPQQFKIKNVSKLHEISCIVFARCQSTIADARSHENCI